jgi:dephospho-CoA kinase
MKKKKILIVGLTGGIGSGKTSVLQLFINKGVPVYIADIEAKKIMTEDKTVVQKIIFTFGEESYVAGELNRPYLASKVFGNQKELDKLNAIVHPAVRQHFLQYVSEQNAAYLIYENAILFENDTALLCDYIITVTAPVETRIARVVARDATTAKQVKERMQHQWTDEEKMAKSDFVIYNLDWDDTMTQVEIIHNEIEKRIGESS